MADISKIQLPDSTELNLKDAVARVSIPFGQVDSTSTSTAFTATIEGITSLYDGVCMYLRNNKVTSASGFTININNLGAKPVYQSMAATSAVTTTFNVNYTMLFVYNSSRVTGGCWDMYYGYYSNTTMAYGALDYYFRAYAGEAIYRYKLVMQGEDNRLYPITITNQTKATQVAKVPTTVGLRPGRVWYYNTTTTIAAGSVIGAQTLQEIGYCTTAAYTFNTTLAPYRMVYLRGTYNREKDLFYLYNDESSPCTSYYTQVPDDTASITLSNYFVSGYYYLLVGGTYSTENYLSLFGYNPLYFFDGTYLIPVEKKIAGDLATSAAQDALTTVSNNYVANSSVTSTVEQGNSNPVTSGGVYTSVQNALTTVSNNYVANSSVTSTVEQNNTNPVTSGGVYTSVQNALATVSNTYVAQSSVATVVEQNNSNPVTSGAVYNAIIGAIEGSY